MSGRQKDVKIHTVKIQQTYWLKDTSEEKMIALGAVHLGRVVEKVDYYDTDLYDLAANEMWLSKIGQEWKLIVGKGSQNKHHQPTNLVTSKKHTPKTSNSKPSENQKKDAIKDQNENTETVNPDRNNALTCYALGQQKEIIAFLSQVLHVHGETSNMAMADFLQVAGIQRYSTISNVNQETYRLPGGYTILLKTEGTSIKKTAVVFLDVEIENVTQGFQSLEQLANELDLQLQSV